MSEWKGYLEGIYRVHLEENECECCFLFWHSPQKETLCEVCKANPEWLYPNYTHARLKRIMKVLDHARLSRYPEVVRMMFSIMKVEDE